MSEKLKVLVAGPTGNLGGKIVHALLALGAEVSGLARTGSAEKSIQELKSKGVQVHQVDFHNKSQVLEACLGMDCVVSALSGLDVVINGTQKILLDAAVQAKVPRFIPSDYSLDFSNLIEGKNRNLDLRRDFHRHAEKQAIALTTVFNGPFMDLLTGEMPMLLLKFKRILYWGSSDQVMDFTHTLNVAEFTARAAMDSTSPRFLYIAGDRVSARDVRNITSEVTGKNFSLLKAGGVSFLDFLIGVIKKLSPGKDELYPAWQGMQYMRDMVQGRVVIEKYDNERYPGMHWISTREFLESENIKNS